MVVSSVVKSPGVAVSRMAHSSKMLWSIMHTVGSINGSIILVVQQAGS
jgi:hypothetical protein